MGRGELSDLVLEAAQEIYSEGLARGSEKHCALSAITVSSLVERLRASEGGYVTNWHVQNALYALFGELREGAHPDITYTSLLRKKVFEEKHGKTLEVNMQRAEAAWGRDAGLYFTMFDQLKGLKLPLSVDAPLAYLIGVFEAKAANVYAETREKYRLRLGRDSTSMRAYSEVIFPLIEDCFSYNFTDDCRARKRNGNGNVTLTSGAIYTFLLDALGLRLDKHSFTDFVRISPERMAVAYEEAGTYRLMGALSVLMNRLPGHRLFKIDTSDSVLAENVELLLVNEGVNPTRKRYGQKERLYLGAEAVARMRSIERPPIPLNGGYVRAAGLFTNPLHLEELGAL